MSLVGAILERRYETGPNSTLQEPTRTILDALGGPAVAAGVRVSETIAEGIPAVYGCVDILANTVGQIPLKLKRRTAEGGSEDDETHSLYPVLHDLANPEMSDFDFRTTMMRWLLLWGNAYAEIVRDAQGRVRQLWPLRSDRMTITRDGLNRLTYTYTLADGTPKVWTFDPARPPIFHLRINSLDGVNGRSPIRVLRESIGFTLAASQYGSRFFANNAAPRGILSTVQNFSKEQREVLRDSWNRVHRGVENVGKIAILEGGLDFKPIGMPPEDAQFIETTKFQLEEIAGRIYHVPNFMVGHTSPSTSWGTGIEQIAIGFVKFTMMPHLTQWTKAIKRDLLSVKSFETHYAAFVTAALERGDFKSLTDALVAQVTNGLINPDEGRKYLDLNARADGKGKDYWRPSNMVAGDAAVTPPVVAGAAA